MSNKRRDIDRRKFLRATGLASTGLFAGCTGGDGDSNGGSDGGTDGDNDGSPDAGTDGGTSGTATDSDDSSEFPERDIRVIIPYSSGGGYDAYARLVANHLPDHLPNDVNVQAQNVEGAGGQIAVDELYREDPDGHTFAIMHVSRFSQMQLVEDVEWDLTEFTWLPTIVSDTYSLAVGPHTGIETWDAFVEAMQNDELRPTSSGPTAGGTVSTIVLGTQADLWSADRVLDNLVVTDGKSQSIQLILGENADFVDGTPETFRPYVESGDLVPIIFSHESPDWSDAPTFEEAGIKNAREIQKFVVTPRSFAAPPDVPEERAEILRTAVSETIQSDELQAQAEEIERPIEYSDSQETVETVETKLQLWRDSPELLELFED